MATDVNASATLGFARLEAVEGDSIRDLLVRRAATSQFENHIRAVAGLPLGDTATIVSRAEMDNLIGDIASAHAGSLSACRETSDNQVAGSRSLSWIAAGWPLKAQ